MAPISQRFEGTQVPIILSSANWQYSLFFILLLFVAFFGVGFWFSGALFGVGFVIYHRLSSDCVLFSDPEKLTVQGTRGFWSRRIFSTDYYWKDLESFRYLSSSKNEPKLHLKWRNRADFRFSGNGLVPFFEYLRIFFPEKEVDSFTSLLG